MKKFITSIAMLLVSTAPVFATAKHNPEEMTGTMMIVETQLYCHGYRDVLDSLQHIIVDFQNGTLDIMKPHEDETREESLAMLEAYGQPREFIKTVEKLIDPTNVMPPEVLREGVCSVLVIQFPEMFQ